MKKYLILIVGVICSFGHADTNFKIEMLQSHSQLRKACKQDALDVFKPKTYSLNVGKVTLNSYSCIGQNMIIRNIILLMHLSSLQENSYSFMIKR
ncbi:hypothetical protein [Acinetobacter defluvii]|uniref:hypothetical protein n=1 Tax=Acinetobacter defluvii TaxID=1871111 RepID=UPI00148F7019|nr:hypothetical protein [Acinetobacter defluvii]